MARNRKRAKGRRSREREPMPGIRPSLAGARADRGERGEDSASPLRHATPDAELAEAQLALGRPELAADDGAAEAAEAADEEEGGELATVTGTAAAPRRSAGSRLVNFLQGSWRELQRVQWPDRRQVMQATGVVIGFVVVAGVFLGVADTVAGKLVNLVIK